MQHPDKSLASNLFVRNYVYLQARQRPSEKSWVLLQEAWDQWRKTPEREQMLQEYRRSGWSLQDSVGTKGKSLSSGMFEIAAERERRRRR